jgi:phage terminase large subunit
MATKKLITPPPLMVPAAPARNSAAEKMAEALAFWGANPVEAIKDWFGVAPEDYQGEILSDLFGAHNRVSIKSGHGVGKTSTEAWANWLYLNTRANSRIVATAPTQSQLKDILWPECAKWHQKMPPELASQWDISDTHIRSKQAPKTWFATARTSNKQENLQGFHGDNIMVLVDEASGVPQPVFEVIEGILTGADEHGLEAKLLMAGNPTQTAGEFYNSFHSNKTLYARFTISGDVHPPKDKNGGKIYVSRRVSDAYRHTMAKKYGKDSAVYDVRVRGLFPVLDDRVVVPLMWAERAQFVELPPFDPIADAITLVMDVARFGGDETTLSAIRRGHSLWMKVWPKTSTNECVDILTEHRKSLELQGLRVGRVIIDEPGVGGGVVDQAKRAGLPVTPYNGGGGLSVENGDPEEDVRMFANRRSRDWWHVRRLLEQGKTRIPEDETLVNQLASVRYEYNERDKIIVESKRKMRERLGEDASPDRADTIVMGLAPFYSMPNSLPSEILDEAGGLYYGELRPTADQDFREFA